MAEAPMEQFQRVQVDIEPDTCEQGSKRVKIRVESHDKSLGWYTSASLCLPLHQLPLLEQALARMKTQQLLQQPVCGSIIPFPALATVAPQPSAPVPPP